MLSETREEWTFKYVALIITLVSLTALLNRTFEGHTGDGCIGKKKGLLSVLCDLGRERVRNVSKEQVSTHFLSIYLGGGTK